MLTPLLHRANATAKLFSRNVLRGPLGRKLKPWLRRLLKRMLRQLICKRQNDPQSASIRLPVESLLAFLGIKFSHKDTQVWTIARITALLVNAMLDNPAVADI